MNASNKRVSRLEAQLVPSAESKEQEEYWKALEERIWESKRSRMTKEELVLEERKMAILHEACRGHKTIAEAIWRGREALRKFEAEQK